MDDLLRSMTWALACEEPNWSGTDVEALAGASLSILRADDEAAGNRTYDPGDFAAKFDGAASKVRSSRAAEEALTRAFEQVKADAAEEIKVDGPKILQRGRSFFVRSETEGYVGPFVSDELWNVAREHLGEHLVMKPSGKVQVRMQPADLVEAYGKGGHLREVCYDLRRQVAGLEGPPTNRTLYLPGPKIDPSLTPTFDAEVARYLELVGGVDHEYLLDFLAVLTELNEPCPALFLKATGGVGKNMIAEACARVWGKAGALDGALALGSFNEEILSNPVIHFEEALPTDHRGRPRVEDFKAAITATSRKAKIKFQSSVQVHGAYRFIVTTNSDEVLRIGAGINASVADSVAQRVVCIATPDENVDAIKAILQRAPGFSVRLARHALWLRDNRAASVVRGRLRMRGLGGVLESDLRLNSDGGMALLEGVALALAKAQTKFLVGSAAKPGVILDAKNDRILLTATGAKEIGAWSPKGPPVRIAAVLARVCGDGRAAPRISSKAWTGAGVVSCYALPLATLAAWADEHLDGGVRAHVARIEAHGGAGGVLGEAPAPKGNPGADVRWST